MAKRGDISLMSHIFEKNNNGEVKTGHGLTKPNNPEVAPEQGRSRGTGNKSTTGESYD